jgi:transposase
VKRCHFIGMDVHSPFTEIAIVTASGQVSKHLRCVTSISNLKAALQAIAKPRHLVFEEGPLADWLGRELHDCVEALTICEPRRNRLICDDGDKDDDLDAAKLAQLLRGGFLKAVHHPQSLKRSVFKQLVGLYHDRVRQRVREALKLVALFKRHGLFVRERDFTTKAAYAKLVERLPEQTMLRLMVRCLWQSYAAAGVRETRVRRWLVKWSKTSAVMRRWQALPGIGPVRAATLFAWLDTPWRFTSKQALWRYLGIGLERQHSGNGPEKLRVPLQVNRLLKGTIVGAAKSAVMQGQNPFADQYRRWIDQGLSSRLARRNVARSLAATLWGMWKNGSVYQPDWVGKASAAVNAAEVSREGKVAYRAAAEFQSKA